MLAVLSLVGEARCGAQARESATPFRDLELASDRLALSKALNEGSGEAQQPGLGCRRFR